MDTKIRLIGGPIDGTIDWNGPSDAPIAFPVDESYRETSDSGFVAVAIYDRRSGEGEATYVFRGFQGKDGQPLPIEFTDGPFQGIHENPFVPAETVVHVGADGSLFAGQGELATVATYGLAERRGKWCYVLEGTDGSPEAIRGAIDLLREQTLAGVILNFYLRPDYSIYTMKPTDRHPQVALEVGWRRGRVDEGIAPLIAELWRLGLDTYGSCQERPEDSEFAGMAYVAFPRRSDAEHFHRLLSAAGIAATLDEKKMRAARRATPEGGPAEDIEFDAANVLFSPSDIEEIANRLSTAAPVRP